MKKIKLMKGKNIFGRRLFGRKQKKLRTAILILHRKVDREHKCICGSNMKFIGENYICSRQYMFNEPSSITVFLENKSKWKN